MNKAKEFTILLGQLEFGHVTEEEKLDFMNFVNFRLKERNQGEELLPLKRNQVVTKDWNALSSTADILQIIGFIYMFLPNRTKEKLKPENFIHMAREHKRRIKGTTTQR